MGTETPFKEVWPTLRQELKSLRTTLKSKAQGLLGIAREYMRSAIDEEHTALLQKKLHEALMAGHRRWAIIYIAGSVAVLGIVGAVGYISNTTEVNTLPQPEPKSSPPPTNEPTRREASSTPRSTALSTPTPLVGLGTLSELPPAIPPKLLKTPTNSFVPSKEAPPPTPLAPPKDPTPVQPPATATAEATEIIPEAPKSFITPRGKELPLGSHLDEFGNGDMYVTSFLAYDPCPDVAKIDDPMLYDPKYEKGGVEFMCFWDDVFNGGAWVDGRRLVYPPKQP